MLPLREKDRVRILAAVTKKGGHFAPRRVLAITGSLLILLAVPLLGLVRIDLWRGHHLLLGRTVGLTTVLQGFVVAMAILYGFTFLTNMIVGRFFCGWGCPVGYVSRLGEDVDLHAKTRFRKVLAHLLGASFVATFVGAVLLWWIDPRVIVEGSTAAKVVVASIFGTLSVGGFLHAFVWRFGFCVHACPIGLYYRYVTSRAPLGIVFEEHPSPCIECGACTTVCPVAIDPRALGQTLPLDTQGASPDDDGPPLRYGDAECIRCGDCVLSCRMVFSKHRGETPPLRFGLTRNTEKTADIGASKPGPQEGRPRRTSG